MQFQEVEISRIKIKDRFREDKGDIPALAQQITDAGRLIQPISLNQYYELVAGERRLLACIALGWTTIPAIIHDITGKVNKLRIELLENIARKDMTWVERARLEKAIFDNESEHDPSWTQRYQSALLDTSLGAVNRRLQLAEALETLPDLAEYTNEDDAFKALKTLEEEVIIRHLEKSTPQEVIQASQWAADHYRVGDAFAGMAGVKAGQVHFADVDPPYGVELDRRKGRNKADTKMSQYNEVDADEYIAFYEKAATEVFRILRNDSFAIFWYGPTWHSETRDTLRKIGFGVADVNAIWTKGAVGQTASPDTSFGSCFEPFWLARKGKPKLAKPGRGNVFDFKMVSSKQKIHSTEKPLDLMAEVLACCCFPGSRIMVPFLGSGVTLRAAYALGHTGFGWDLSERHKELFLRKVRGEIVEGEEDASDVRQ